VKEGRNSIALRWEEMVLVWKFLLVSKVGVRHRAGRGLVQSSAISYPYLNRVRTCNTSRSCLRLSAWLPDLLGWGLV
jgi:hypothetical protein